MTTYLSACESHLERLTSSMTDICGGMWPSVVDVRSGRYPAGEHTPRRVYRLIGAPRGSTLYWDQPMLVSAYVLTSLTGRPLYARAADRYVEAFLASCVADNGMFRWGNHEYYDVFERRIVAFSGGCHELRPITPAWDVFFRHSPRATQTYIRTMLRRHIYDPATGGFNRHDDGRKGHAFLEAGGILSESAAWLHGKTGDDDLLETALRIARYSYGRRHRSTGLVPNEPDMGRWDADACTSEIGLWAQCLLRAARCTDNDEFTAMAVNAIRAYLQYAHDPATDRYFGRIAVGSGRPVFPEQRGYWPRRFTDPWNTDQWPTHDYPMALAEACLSLHELTGEDIFLDGVRRLARMAVEYSPGQTGHWAYAESYGRCIHFLVRAGLRLGDEDMLTAASSLAGEAVGCLGDNGMIQGYPDSGVYESVDGVGYLLLAFMFLESQRELDLQGFGF